MRHGAAWCRTYLEGPRMPRRSRRGGRSQSGPSKSPSRPPAWITTSFTASAPATTSHSVPAIGRPRVARSVARTPRASQYPPHAAHSSPSSSHARSGPSRGPATARTWSTARIPSSSVSRRRVNRADAATATRARTWVDVMTVRVDVPQNVRCGVPTGREDSTRRRDSRTAPICTTWEPPELRRLRVSRTPLRASPVVAIRISARAHSPPGRGCRAPAPRAARRSRRRSRVSRRP